MICRNRLARGASIIAMVLMLITFFLVIGFSIGALSTMNLNLSGRSVCVVKSDMIAKGAIDQFLKHVEEKAQETMVGTLDHMTLPPLELDTYYNGIRNIFEPLPDYIGPRCSADVHFVRLGPSDRYYSSDNSNNYACLDGAQGRVPPFTIDLIVNVKIGDFMKHYQVWIVRKWDYAIYSERGPTMLLSNFTLNPFNNKIPTEVNGNIFCNYQPTGGSTPQPPQPRYKIITILSSNSEQTTTCEVENFFTPEPDATYPAAVTVGGRIIEHTVVTSPSPDNTVRTVGWSTGNKVNGRVDYPWPKPTVSPGYDHLTYPGNTLTKDGAFDATRVLSPIDALQPVDDSTIPATNYINEVNYPDSIRREDNALIDDGTCPPAVYPTNGVVTYSYDKIYGPDSGMVDQKNALYAEYLSRKGQYASTEQPLFFLKKTLKIRETPGPDPMQWGSDAKFVVKGDDERYLPLVDGIRKYFIDFNSISSDVYDPDSGVTTTTETHTLTNLEEVYAIDSAENDLKLDNSMVISQQPINLVRSDLMGENSLLQLHNPSDVSRGQLFMASGKITAGTNVPMVIYCNDLYCKSDGVFNGIIITRNSLKVVGIGAPSFLLEVRGALVVGGRGEFGTVDPLIDSGGLLTCGFRIIHEPRYTVYLNRCGSFRVISWRDIQ